MTRLATSGVENDQTPLDIWYAIGTAWGVFIIYEADKGFNQ